MELFKLFDDFRVNNEIFSMVDNQNAKLYNHTIGVCRIVNPELGGSPIFQQVLRVRTADGLRHR